jgi:LDH2 family malate/lactate/ureidoglycolate dehydrogenase
MPVYSATQLQSLTKEIFQAKGTPELNAEIVAKLLVSANLASES